MFNKKFSKDVFLVILSNGVKLLSSVLSVFVIPLIFSKQDYGFYKLFLLYVSYVGLFHFGFIDGIYLHYAGKSYEELDKSSFRVFTRFLVILELIVAVLVFGLSFTFTGARQMIMVLVALNLVALNLTSYYQFISQITGRFKEFAARNVVFTILNVLLIAGFYVFKMNNYLHFLIITVIINYILLFWYIITYRDISFGHASRIKGEKKQIIFLFKLGIVLLLSNLITVFIANIPKQFVDIMYPVEVYPDVFSNFSFAYTLMSFTSVFLTAISLVLYPTLKKSNKEELKNKYNSLNAFILGLVFLLLAAYFPMSWIVEKYLPNYTSSLDIFFVLSPGIAITSAISVVIHNYYKSLEKNKNFLIIGIITLVILILTMVLVYKFISEDILYIATITVIVEFIWYLLLDLFLNKEYKNFSLKNILFIILTSALFYMTDFIDNRLINFFVYSLSVVIILLLIYMKELLVLIKKIRYKERI